MGHVGFYIIHAIFLLLGRQHACTVTHVAILKCHTVEFPYIFAPSNAEMLVLSHFLVTITKSFF